MKLLLFLSFIDCVNLRFILEFNSFKEKYSSLCPQGTWSICFYLLPTLYYMGFCIMINFCSFPTKYNKSKKSGGNEYGHSCF